MPQDLGPKRDAGVSREGERVTSCSPENLQRLPEPTPQAVAQRAAERHDWPRPAALRDEPGGPGGKEVAAVALHQPRSAGGRVPHGAQSGVGGRGAGSQVPSLPAPDPPGGAGPQACQQGTAGSPEAPRPHLARSVAEAGQAQRARPARGARGDPEAPSARPRPGQLTLRRGAPPGRAARAPRAPGRAQ